METTLSGSYTKTNTPYTKWVVDEQLAEKKINEEILKSYVDQNGVSLADLSDKQPTLLIFLRQLGCTFCRETVHDIFFQRKTIEASGASIAFVHMAEEGQAKEFFEAFQVDDLPRFSDTRKQIYRAFGLKKGSFRQLYGWQVIKRSWQNLVKKEIGQGKTQGDATQMPGVFLIEKSTILQAYRHQYASDQVNYSQFSP